LTLTNYRGFEQATIDLDRPLTVLFGVNGSGKSSVLNALATAATNLYAYAYANVAGYWRFYADNHDIREGSDCAELSVDWTNADVSITVTEAFARDQQSDARQPVGDVGALYRAARALTIFYGSAREVATDSSAFIPVQRDNGQTPDRPELATYDALVVGHLKFRTLFQWFKNREDTENELKVSRQDLTLEDPQLAAVRRAVAGMLPGFSGLRIQRDPLHMVILKGDTLLAVDQLSDGERLLLALTADLARRLAITYADAPDPLSGEAIVLIDEVELHLHPTWQRRVLGALRSTFPNCQFIVTTHSPQVLSEVPNDSVVLVKDFQFVRPGAPTAGRDSNAILTEAMGTPDRPVAQAAAIESIAALLDEGRHAEARAQLDALALQLTERDR
jgi:predicted ATP-binding protein involved in virulence